MTAMRRLALLAPLLALTACGDAPAPAAPAPAPAATAPALTPAQEAREREIRKVRAADAVGYDGAGIERTLRKTLDAVDANQKRLDEAAKQAEQGNQ